MRFLPLAVAIPFLLSLAACSPVDPHRVEARDISNASDSELPNLVGQLVIVEGELISGKNNYFVVDKAGGNWLLTFKDHRTPSDSLLGTHVRAQGRLAVFHQKLNDQGALVDKEGLAIQGFGGARDVYHLVNVVLDSPRRR